nr:hypothetical protein [Tanacetum cinerariifolium]
MGVKGIAKVTLLFYGMGLRENDFFVLGSRVAAGFKMDFFKGMSYDEIRPIFEKHFNSIVGFLEKGEEKLEEEASRTHKRKSKSSEQQAAKKQKFDEEVEELKKHLQIVPNDEDDVYTEATPLSHMEESKRNSWFSKSQVLEIVKVLWSSHHNIHYNSDDLAGRKKISFDKIHFRLDVE